MPGLASGIARQVREGEIKKFLIQPIDLIGYLLLARIAHKVGLLSRLRRGRLPWCIICAEVTFQGWPPTEVMAAFLLSLVMAFLLGFFLEATMGMISFWFLEVSSLLFVYMLFTFFFSGHMFPLDILPEPWRTIVDFLPFKYMAYFPAAVFLGKVQGTELVHGLMIQSCMGIGVYRAVSHDNVSWFQSLQWIWRIKEQAELRMRIAE